MKICYENLEKYHVRYSQKKQRFYGGDKGCISLHYIESCEICGEPFLGNQKASKYCSANCTRVSKRKGDGKSGYIPKSNIKEYFANRFQKGLIPIPFEMFGFMFYSPADILNLLIAKYNEFIFYTTDIQISAVKRFYSEITFLKEIHIPEHVIKYDVKFYARKFLESNSFQEITFVSYNEKTRQYLCEVQKICEI